MFVTVRQLWVCSLTKRQVCHLQFLLALARIFILASWFHETYFTISDSRLSQPKGLFTSPRDRVVQLYPQALSPLFIASNNSQDDGGNI
jgi:hypothetical protein